MFQYWIQADLSSSFLSYHQMCKVEVKQAAIPILAQIFHTFLVQKSFQSLEHINTWYISKSDSNSCTNCLAFPSDGFYCKHVHLPFVTVPIPAPVYYLLYQNISLKIVYADSCIGRCLPCLERIYLSETALFKGRSWGHCFWRPLSLCFN